MIHYDLRCGEGHIFDGWFRSSAAFEQQADRGLLDCPVCASNSVSRAIMAPRLNRGAAARRQAAGHAPEANAANEQAIGTALAPAGQAPTATTGGQKMPDEVRAALQRLRCEVERKCDYVGNRFADEARAIHRGEQAPRSIYGETTPDQAEALADEGIEVARIPWVPRADG
jgi:hypothetical protein